MALVPGALILGSAAPGAQALVKICFILRLITKLKAWSQSRELGLASAADAAAYQASAERPL